MTILSQTTDDNETKCKSYFNSSTKSREFKLN